MNKRKTLCLILALSMVLSLAACGNNFSDKPATEPASTTPSSADAISSEPPIKTESVESIIPENLPAFKIGCVGVYTGLDLYIQWKNNMLSLEEKYNVSFQFVDSQGDTAADIENMCVAGVNGIIMQGCSESILQITEKYNVPLVAYCCDFSEEEMEAFSKFSTFLGVVTEKDSLGGLEAAEAMYNAGCRNVAVAGLTKGVGQSIDDRAEYFISHFTELGGNIIAEDYTFALFADSISSFAVAYPEMDGVFSAFLTEGVFQVFTTEGLIGNVKLASFDYSGSCDEFFENGTMVYTACGQQGTIMAAFVILYNYLYDGTYLVPDRSQQVYRNWINIYNAQDSEDYNNYIRYSTIYTPEEIATMIIGFNPEFDFDQFMEIQRAYTIADVKARAGA